METFCIENFNCFLIVEFEFLFTFCVATKLNNKILYSNFYKFHRFPDVVFLFIIVEATDN